MGFGDTLMAMGEAKALHKKTGSPVMLIDRYGRPQKSDLFDGVSYLTRSLAGHGGGHVHRMLNCGGHRPYIAAKAPERWTWRPYQPKPAGLVYTPQELAFAECERGRVLIEPHTKAVGHSNKAWLWDRWQAVVDSMRDVRFVQVGPVGTQWLDGVDRMPTSTFRQALAVQSVCRAYVGTEGGLMHGAAANRTPAVVLWSEFIDPSITGYASMTNLRHAGKACGSRLDCPGCKKSMLAISVDEVVQSLKGIL